MRRPMLPVLAACAALFAAPGAHAAAYDALYVFGDSLSDRGNLAETGIVQAGAGLPPVNYPDPPSFHDSFTNGDVAVQVLARRLGLSAEPSLWLTGFRDVNGLFGPAGTVSTGTNYAVAGATAVLQAPDGPVAINLPQQVGAYLGRAGTADPSALYTVFIGGNDVRNAALHTTTADAANAAIAAGVASEIAAIQTLQAAGARNFLVVNVPDVGAIPEFTQDNPTLAAQATQLSRAYDTGLSSALAGLVLPAGTTITGFDLFAFNDAVAENAVAYGITNTTDRCFTAAPLSAAATPACGGAGGPNIASFYFWDAIHPTAVVHALDGNAFADALSGSAPAPVPEPASAALLGVGLLGLAVLRRR